MLTVLGPEQRTWDATEADAAAVIKLAREQVADNNALVQLDAGIEGGMLDLSDREDPLALTIGIGLRRAVALAVEAGLRKSPGAGSADERASLRRLDELLQLVIAPRRRGQFTTFPTRRVLSQLDERGIAVGDLAQVIGLPVDDAAEHIRRLGCRNLRVDDSRMDLVPLDLDVAVDRDRVTNIVGFHV